MDGEQAQALLHVLVVDVAPVLVEVEGAGLGRIQPQGTLLGLAHLAAVMGQKQLEGAGESINNNPLNLNLINAN